MPDRTPCVGGNWKMNTRGGAADALAAAVADRMGGIQEVEVVVFPPAVYLERVSGVLEGTNVEVGGQDISPEDDGAFTGQLSGGMLKDAGCNRVLVGHSERRHGLSEPDELLNAKVHAGLAAGLEVMLCIGETLEEREQGRTGEIVTGQVKADLAGVPAASLQQLTIAYEPVWAIGTGRTASPQDAQAVHELVRGTIGDLYDAGAAEAMRVLYGGSVKTENAAELFAQADIDGGLIGGASLDADAFMAIVEAAASTRVTG